MTDTHLAPIDENFDTSIRPWRELMSELRTLESFPQNTMNEGQIDRLNKLERALLENPTTSPELLCWKLDRLLTIEADGFTDSWRADLVEQTVIDYRRMLRPAEAPARRDADQFDQKMAAWESEQLACASVPIEAGDEAVSSAIDRLVNAEIAWLELPAPDHGRAFVRACALLEHYEFGERLAGLAGHQALIRSDLLAAIAGFADQANQVRHLNLMAMQ